MLIPKWIARRPIVKTKQYLKFGFVVTECESHVCPRCRNTLNAGPEYQPKYCDQCGQRIDFSKTEWKEEKQLGYAERKDVYESVKN